MKSITIIVAALLLSLGLATGAGASLIGDDVIVQWIQNDVVLQQSESFTIEAGDQDTVTTGFGQIRVDIEADRVIIDFVGGDNLPLGYSTFFGIKILGLQDVDNPDWVLLGADVTTNTMTSASRWYAEEDDRLLIDPLTGDIGFDWHQMSYRPGQNFTALLEFGPNPIPIPATMALFVTGLIGFILMRRKKKE